MGRRGHLPAAPAAHHGDQVDRYGRRCAVGALEQNDSFDMLHLGVDKGLFEHALEHFANFERSLGAEEATLEVATKVIGMVSTPACRVSSKRR